jgi:hypothetical protein
MEFQEIYQALGQSLNYEDWLGDFTRARQAADQWLAGIDAGASLEERVDALTWSAIVHILSGELNRAEEALDEAESLAGGDNNRLLRIQTYRLLAMYERFNTYPDGGGAASVEVSARWRGTPDLQGPNNRWELLRASADSQDIQFESWYVYGFLCNLKPVRGTCWKARAMRRPRSTKFFPGLQYGHGYPVESTGPRRRSYFHRDICRLVRRRPPPPRREWTGRSGNPATCARKGHGKRIPPRPGALPDEPGRLAGGPLQHAHCLELRPPGKQFRDQQPGRFG